MLPPAFHAFVGVAGDLNVGEFRSAGDGDDTDWLVLTAMIVTTENLDRLESWRDQVFSFSRDPCTETYHTMDPRQRMDGLTELSLKPVGLISVLSNKTTLPEDPIFQHMSQPAELFRYVARYLIERVSEIAARKAEQLENPYARAAVILPRAPEHDPAALRDYLHLLERRQSEGAAYTAHGIQYDHLDMDALDDGKVIASPGLQLAQLVADCFLTAVEPDAVPSAAHAMDCISTLQRRIVRNATGHSLDTGIKPMPNLSRMQLSNEQLRFFRFWD